LGFANHNRIGDYEQFAGLTGALRLCQSTKTHRFTVKAAPGQHT
jgi:hypothetical protein